MKCKYLLSLLVILLLIVTLPGDLLAETFSTLRHDYHQLQSSSQLQRQRKNWEKLIDRFSNFTKHQRQDKNIEKGYFLLARTWDGLSKASGGRKDARQAINHYIDLVDHFPKSYLADDALFSAAEIAELQLHDQVMAYNFYLRLVKQLPNGDMVMAAQQNLDRLPVPAEKKPMQVRPVVQNYQAIGKAPRLVNIRYWSGPEYTRIVLDLTAPVVVKPNYIKGKNPRLYFDLLYATLGAKLPATVPIRNGLVKQVRSSRYNKQKTRVVLDLNRVAEYKLANLDNPHRLVIDVKGRPAKVGLSTISAEEKSIIADDSIAKILNNSSERQTVLHVPQKTHDEGIHLIVVDAGHGGKDPGAIGPHKIYEKDVVLKMAHALARELRKQMGVKVLLTRSDDHYLKLRERTEYANRVGADLFISLHANATRNGKAYGVETYFLNLSKNNQAAEVAARENGTTLKEVGNLEGILFDLMANSKINESSRLAAEVQQALISGLRSHYSRVRDLGVKQGPFHVLLGATMPSVLVESGFISNFREEKRLLSSNYQKRVAAAIVEGVKKYAATLDQVAKQ
jgi:N-acetylmuramoyl-L-alanine amidase